MTRFEDEWYETQTPRTRAALRAAGVGRRTIAGASYRPTSHGHHRLILDPEKGATATQRIIDALPLVPEGGLIGGWAAAYAHGVLALDGLDHLTLAALPVPIVLPPGMRRRDTATVTYRQSSRPATAEVVCDVPVTSPWRTIFDLSRYAVDLTEAVVAVDAFLGARLVTPAALCTNIARVPSRRGVRQAREAVKLARPCVRSTWETRLRIFAVLELGLTDLQPNRAVFDRTGTLLGVPDLLDVDAGLALEYDGASWRTDRRHGHRDRDQHREDNAREERLERTGLIVVRAEKADLTRHRAALTDRIRAAYADGLSRDRTRDRWTLEEPEGWIGLPA